MIFTFVCNSSNSYIRLNKWTDSYGDIHNQPYYSSSDSSLLDVYITIPLIYNNMSNSLDMSSNSNSSLSIQRMYGSWYYDYVYNLLYNNTLPVTYNYTQANAKSNSSVMFYASTNPDGSGSTYRATGRYYNKFWGFFIVDSVQITNVNFIKKYIGYNAIANVGDYTLSFYFNTDLDGLFNSLLIYNYNSNLLQKCNSVYMNLARSTGSGASDYQHYNLGTPTDFTFPNYLYTSFISTEYSSVIFTELMNVNFVISDDDISDIVYFDNYVMSINLGFDFNLIYSSHPLVTDDSVFDIDFEKPSYVKAEFSLSPFYIPVLELAQNLIIFIMFYCPIISDIFNYIGLNVFLSTLLTVVQFIVGLPLGQFVIALIGFFIFFNIVKSFMPVLYSSAGETYTAIYDDIPHPYESFKEHIWTMSQKDRDYRNRRLFNKTKLFKPNHRYHVKLKGYKLAPIVKQTRGVSSAMLINRDKVFGRHHKYRVKLKHFKALPKKKQLRGVSSPILVNKNTIYKKDSKYKVKMKSYKPVGSRDKRLRRKYYDYGLVDGANIAQGIFDKGTAHRITKF